MSLPVDMGRALLNPSIHYYYYYLTEETRVGKHHYELLTLLKWGIHTSNLGDKLCDLEFLRQDELCLS